MFVLYLLSCKFIHRIFLKFLNHGNELHVSESFSFFGFKNKQFPVNFNPVQAFNSVSNKKNLQTHQPSYLKRFLTLVPQVRNDSADGAFCHFLIIKKKKKWVQIW